MNPYIQPKSMEELEAMLQPGGPLNPHQNRVPMLMPKTPQFTTALDVQTMIDASLARTVQAAANPLSQFDTIFQRALPAEDFAAFTAYVSLGAPGFGDLMATEKLDPIAQLLWETIKENIK